MQLPDLVLLDHEGQPFQLRDRLLGRPGVLVFLRHFGCVFCREQVARLNEDPALPVTYITLGSSSEAARHESSLHSPHQFLADPDRQVYRYFGLERASIKQLFGPDVVKRGFEAVRNGTRGGFVPTADPIQLGGAFVYNQAGEVVWARKSRDAADNVSVDQLRQALREAA